MQISEIFLRKRAENVTFQQSHIASDIQKGQVCRKASFPMAKDKSLTAAALVSSLKYIQKDANKIMSQNVHTWAYRDGLLKFCIQRSLGNIAKLLKKNGSPDSDRQSSLEEPSFQAYPQTAHSCSSLLSPPQWQERHLEATWLGFLTDYTDECTTDKLSICPGLFHYIMDLFVSTSHTVGNKIMVHSSYSLDSSLETSYINILLILLFSKRYTAPRDLSY